MTQQDTQPPAETLAEAMHCALKDAAAIATAEADRLAKEMPMGSRSEGTARAIAADITRLAVAALTRRAGGDAGTIDRCIEKLEQTARWSISDGRKWFNHPAANEAFEYAIAALRTVEPNAGGDAIPAGMKPWHGGDAAPEDWDGGPVLLRDGTSIDRGDGKAKWRHASPGSHMSLYDAIAYTPKPSAGGDAIGQSDGDPDGWLAVKVNAEGGIVMPYGPLHAGPDRPNDARYRWAPFYLGDPR